MRNNALHLLNICGFPISLLYSLIIAIEYIKLVSLHTKMCGIHNQNNDNQPKTHTNYLYLILLLYFFFSFFLLFILVLLFHYYGVLFCSSFSFNRMKWNSCSTFSNRITISFSYYFVYWHFYHVFKIECNLFIINSFFFSHWLCASIYSVS